MYAKSLDQPDGPRGEGENVKYGYTLYSEGNGPLSLIEQAVQAEQAGFDFLVMSDHYHPWVNEQTHAGFAWSMLGAVAQATSRVELATMVTCPTIRYHPAIIAQAAATMGVLSHGRFTLGLGAGENLNEHVVGRDWPPVTVRHAMLKEAIEIIQGLWRGEYFAYHGEHFTVYDARVFDLPDRPVEIFVGASGGPSVDLALQGGGVCVTSPDPEVIATFTAGGGDPTHTWGQLVTAWAPTTDAGLDDAYLNFRTSPLGWKVMAELPNPTNFTAATASVRPEDLEKTIPAGPDVARHLKGIGEYRDAGVERLAVAYPGRDFDGFFRFWHDELRPNLA
jgi:G6PDH family F420-dependent oxidoreductase